LQIAASNKTLWPAAMIALVTLGAHALVRAQAPAPAQAVERIAPKVAGTGLNVSELASVEKQTRELELLRKISGLSATLGNPNDKKPTQAKSRPVLWSLTGTTHRYQAEVVHDKKLMLISSGQDLVPSLGRLEWIDDTGVYIRPPKHHKLDKSWLNSTGMLVLSAPRDGQAQPVLVDSASHQATALGVGLGGAGSAVPLVLPQAVPGFRFNGPATFAPLLNPASAAPATSTSMAPLGQELVERLQAMPAPALAANPDKNDHKARSAP